jgi:hypothetical protein
MTKDDRPNLTADVPDEVFADYKALCAAFRTGRAILAKISPPGSTAEFYCIAVMPFNNSPPIPIAVLPHNQTVLEMVHQYDMWHAEEMAERSPGLTH